MKTRKKNSQLAIEKRNALYNKTMQRNITLAQKNTELSCLINKYKNAIDKANERRWYQFWKIFRKLIII